MVLNVYELQGKCGFECLYLTHTRKWSDSGPEQLAIEKNIIRFVDTIKISLMIHVR